MELRALLKATLVAQGLTGRTLRLVVWGFGSFLGTETKCSEFFFFP